MEQSNEKQYKIVLVGDGGVGKTSYIKKLITGNFEKKYLPTIGVEVFKLTMNNCILNIWDCAGQDKFSGLADGYYINADAAIIMFDNNSMNSLYSTSSWYRKLNRVVPNIPVVLVGNKIDTYNPDNEKNINSRYNAGSGETIFITSVKRNINLDAPFKYLLEQLAIN